MAIPVTAIFDIGKTNKKFFLFDANLNELKEEYIKFPLTRDDDGYPCDDLESITHWIKKTIEDIAASSDYKLEGINFSTYGATLVHLDENGRPVTPLYNYLKPFPQAFADEFFAQNEEESNCLETASPNLGMLNSGFQLYWLKREKPHLYKKIKYTLHFPQYLSYLFTGKMVCEPTSLGCHTRLWDYTKNNYHHWVIKEGFNTLFPKYVPTTQTYLCNIGGQKVKVGVGIHDSSSALASYLLRIQEPFLLISTGTWSITLNPFTTDELTCRELERDCLNFLSINGSPVKASRFFLGHELDHQLDKLNSIFQKDPRYYKTVDPNPDFIEKAINGEISLKYFPETIQTKALVADIFTTNKWNPDDCSTFEEAYHQVLWGLVKLQVASFNLARGNTPTKTVYIDGGFVNNKVFMAFMKEMMEGYNLIFSDFPLGSAYGAAGLLKDNITEPVP